MNTTVLCFISLALSRGSMSITSARKCIANFVICAKKCIFVIETSAQKCSNVTKIPAKKCNYIYGKDCISETYRMER